MVLMRQELQEDGDPFDQLCEHHEIKIDHVEVVVVAGKSFFTAYCSRGWYISFTEEDLKKLNSAEKVVFEGE